MRNRRIKPNIEIIPLMDVMFLLLLFFICAVLNVAGGRQLPIELPDAMSALLPEKDYLQVIINDSQLLLNGRPISLSDLAFTEKNKKIYVAADKNISYGRVAEVLSALNNAGVKKISLETK